MKLKSGEQDLQVSRDMLEKAMNTAVELVRRNLPEYTRKFHSSNSHDGFYHPVDNTDWTTGFWTGAIWLAYEYTGDMVFRQAAEYQVRDFLHRIENLIDTDHHDMGFLYSLSCVSAFKLTGNQEAKKAALLAAEHLNKRYCEKGKFIQAWGNAGDLNENRLIIDCLMNLPLLYWASEVTGNRCYRDNAKNHMETAMNCLIRADHTTYHTYYFDVDTGKPLRGSTHQGNRNESVWSRGQAWGIYGIALGCKYLQNTRYISSFEELTNYFIMHLPDDQIPYWDFDFTTGSMEAKDSSASAIAVCGILEMAGYLEKKMPQTYLIAADRMLSALINKCANRSFEESNGILLHGTYAKSSKWNTCTDHGVNECNTWGDYFYMEALMRRLTDWKTYW